MAVTGLALLARQFRYSFDPLAFTVFFALGELGCALVPNVVFAYPTGRVTDPLERAFLKVAYAAALAFPFALLLFYDGSRPMRYFPPFPHESLLLVQGDVDVVHALKSTYAVLVYGVLVGCLHRAGAAEARARGASGPTHPRAAPPGRRGDRPPRGVRRDPHVRRPPAPLHRRQRLLVADRRPDRAAAGGVDRVPAGAARAGLGRRPRRPARADAAAGDPRRARSGPRRPDARGRALAAGASGLRRRRGCTDDAPRGRAGARGHAHRPRRRAARGARPRPDAARGTQAGRSRRGGRALRARERAPRGRAAGAAGEGAGVARPPRRRRRRGAAQDRAEPPRRGAAAPGGDRAPGQVRAARPGRSKPGRTRCSTASRRIS